MSRFRSCTLNVKLVIADVVLLRVAAVDGVDESTGESGLVEKGVVRTEKVISLVAHCAVVVHLAAKLYVGVVAIVTAFAVKVVLRNGNVKGIIGEIGPLQFVGKVRVGVVVDDAAIWPGFVIGRQSGRRRSGRWLCWPLLKLPPVLPTSTSTSTTSSSTPSSSTPSSASASWSLCSGSGGRRCLVIVIIVVLLVVVCQRKCATKSNEWWWWLMIIMMGIRQWLPLLTVIVTVLLIQRRFSGGGRCGARRRRTAMPLSTSSPSSAAFRA